MNFYDAEKAVKRAAIVTFIIVFINLLKLFVVYMSGTEETAAEFFKDPFNYFDIVLIFICGMMILRYSRAAGIILFLYFFVSKIIQFVEIDNLVTLIGAGIISLIIIIFYINGIRAAYAYHRLKKAENPEYKAAAKWTYYTGIPLIVISILFIIVGIMSEMGTIPSYEVISGSDLPKDDVKLLIKERIIKPDETIKLFYSSGLTSIIENGNILTDKRVISYELIDDKLDVYATTFEDVEKVSIVEQGDYLSDTIVEILTKNGGFYLLLSNENHGDQRFIDEIENNVF
ncbi:MAG: hypothetical protein JKY19_10750 [Alcanivoracaceae bacterium]|nr:hypothetical protein [Alcanivoracaceae bacterium]